jgi:allophanate hydrolase
VRPVLAGVDALVVPTAPTAYTLAEVEADNIRLNSRLGTYTNFANLLDLCGLALPAAISGAGLPYGITLLAPAGGDARLAALGRAWQQGSGLPLGATGLALPPAVAEPAMPEAAGGDRVTVAVFGAHLSGLPLNGELRALGAEFLGEARTAAAYRLHLLPGGPPLRPGLLRVADGTGTAIAAELWSLPPEGFGRLVAGIPAPLGFGTVALEDGRLVKGFLAEAAGLAGARDITAHGGWRAFLAAAGGGG